MRWIFLWWKEGAYCGKESVNGHQSRQYACATKYAQSSHTKLLLFGAVVWHQQSMYVPLCKSLGGNFERSCSGLYHVCNHCLYCEGLKTCKYSSSDPSIPSNSPKFSIECMNADLYKNFEFCPRFYRIYCLKKKGHCSRTLIILLWLVQFLG